MLLGSKRSVTRLTLLALLLTTGGDRFLEAEEKGDEVETWLRTGDLYLSQGLYESARSEYQKVLDAIPPQQRPAILQKMARCYYQQGKLNASIVALKRAVLLAPHSDVTRQLLALTMENNGQGSEGREWLNRLDREGPGALAVELGGDPPADELQFHRDRTTEARPEPPSAHRYGAHRIALEERSPWSAMDIYRQRFAISRQTMVVSDPAAGEYDLASESFEILVPETYDPQKPAGLVVWVSPTETSELTRPENQRVLAEKNLIWIGANNSGNDRWHWYRVGLALDAAYNMQRLYSIDPERVFVAGYSGGGRVAASLALLYPETFQGGAFFFGAGYFRKVPVPGGSGAYWRAAFPAPNEQDLDRLRKQHRFVLITGERDFNRDETRAYFRAFEKDRFRNVTFLEIPKADHGYGVRGEWLARVVEALDKRPSR